MKWSNMTLSRVLILCTGNSCRSQMAEALWRELGYGEWECHSAGSRPVGFVHPGALAALREDGLQLPDASSKSVDTFEGQSFDCVVTVCDAAQSHCPVFSGSPTLHWPFPDPAEATGDQAQQLAVFESVRESIRRRIAEHLDCETAEEYVSWLRQSCDSHPGGVPAARREEYDRFIEQLVTHWDDPWRAIPRSVLEVFGVRGFEWNGFYRNDGDALRLGPAAGPPVCAQLDRHGGIGRSGMCYDALLTQLPLATNDVSSWPGYVNCDAESGLTTAAAMTIPIRNRGGRVVAVWDLDGTEPLAPTDLWFFATAFGALTRFRAPVLA